MKTIRKVHAALLSFYGIEKAVHSDVWMWNNFLSFRRSFLFVVCLALARLGTGTHQKHSYFSHRIQTIQRIVQTWVMVVSAGLPRHWDGYECKIPNAISCCMRVWPHMAYGTMNYMRTTRFDSILYLFFILFLLNFIIVIISLRTYRKKE